MSELLDALREKARICRGNDQPCNADEYDGIADHIEELEAERKTWDGHKVCELLRKDVAELVIQIERVKALPDEWRRAGSLMIDAERCLTDLEEALEGEAE